MKRITVKVTDSTFRWLTALAKANSENAAGIEPTASALLSQAAFCFADYAGRRPGSWEADVGGSLLRSSGIHNEIERRESLFDADNDELEQWRRARVKIVERALDTPKKE
jgi:hypothetical protein